MGAQVMQKNSSMRMGDTDDRRALRGCRRSTNLFETLRENNSSSCELQLEKNHIAGA
jgi:hypothetical protein